MGSVIKQCVLVGAGEEAEGRAHQHDEHESVEHLRQES